MTIFQSISCRSTQGVTQLVKSGHAHQVTFLDFQCGCITPIYRKQCHNSHQPPSFIDLYDLHYQLAVNNALPMRDHSSYIFSHVILVQFPHLSTFHNRKAFIWPFTISSYRQTTMESFNYNL